jgi:hypothetical protein
MSEIYDGQRPVCARCIRRHNLKRIETRLEASASCADRLRYDHRTVGQAPNELQHSEHAEVWVSTTSVDQPVRCCNSLSWIVRIQRSAALVFTADLTQSADMIVAAASDLADVLSQCQLTVEKNTKISYHFGCLSTDRETAIKVC